MGLDAADFHYLTILRELEKALSRLEQRKPTSDRRQTYRTAAAFRTALPKLTAKGFGANIGVALQASAEVMAKTETASAQVIRDLTEARPRLARLAAGDWPPMVPAARMVERFTALTIGKHSEDPAGSLTEHAEESFRLAVLPALAWGLVAHLYELSENLRADAQAALARHFRGKPQPHQVEVRLGEDEERVPFRYLRLIEGWFRVLETPSAWQLAPERIAALRTELAKLLERRLTDLDTHLWEVLGDHYTAQAAGSERARVVAQASEHSRHSAGFLRDRLQLFAAANTPALRKFRLLTERNLERAVAHAFAAEQENPADPKAAGHEACGAAFWLARACFGHRTHVPSAAQVASSKKVILLLLRAAALLKQEPDLRMTCVRYAAGFATNPRYIRAGLVLELQERLVDLYAGMPDARRSLANLFRGRICWQRWQAGLADDPHKAVEHYGAALREHRHAEHGFDAEAPVHFFPELQVLLQEVRKREKRERSTLEVVDFITQRNYGIYFDVVEEERMIQDGLEAFKDFKALCLKRLTKRLKTTAVRNETFEGSDWENLGDTGLVLAEMDPDTALYRSLVSDLRSIPGVTFRKR
ncbi:MAG: hypothetical protein RLZZ550_1711 [Verrucomicrobiota bacterium]